jgi:autotransporter-associated beta strand protein
MSLSSVPPTSRYFSTRLPHGLAAQLLGLLLATLAPAAMRGATTNWIGASSNWFTITNWSILALPTSGDNLRFTNAGFNTPTISGFGAFANSITFVAGAIPFTIDGTQTLTVTDITNASTSLQTFSVSTIALGNSANWSANAGALSFSSAVSLGSKNLTLGSSGGQASDISGIISGSGKVTVQSGVWTLSNGANSYTGSTNISGGTLVVTANGALGNISGGATLDLKNVAYSAAQPLTANGSSTLAVSSGTSSFAGPISLSGSQLNVNVTGTLLTLSGVISGGSGEDLAKSGAGTLTLSGTTSNTYGGNTLINAGTLILAKTAGLNAIAGGQITIGASGVLRLGASNQIANGVDMQLNGGTFALNNFSETLGKLDLSANGGTIDFGGTAAALVFAKSAGENWNGGTLGITNYTTASNSLRFGSDNSGLTSSQLASIIFEGYGLGAQIDANGFVTPVPEPATYAALFGAVALVVAGYRRRNGAGRG